MSLPSPDAIPVQVVAGADGGLVHERQVDLSDEGGNADFLTEGAVTHDAFEGTPEVPREETVNHWIDCTVAVAEPREHRHQDVGYA